MPIEDWTAFFRAGAEIQPLLKAMREKCYDRPHTHQIASASFLVRELNFSAME